MSASKENSKDKIKLVKMPSFTRLLIGGFAAYWLSTIMNPAFVAIAVLVFLLIPIITVDNAISKELYGAYEQKAEPSTKEVSAEKPNTKGKNSKKVVKKK
jgi:hypothetical protein